MKKVIITILFITSIILVCGCKSGLNPPDWIIGEWNGLYKNKYSGNSIKKTWIFQKQHVFCITNNEKKEYKDQFFIQYTNFSKNNQYIIRIDSSFDNKPTFYTFKKLSEEKLKLVEYNIILYRNKKILRK